MFINCTIFVIFFKFLKCSVHIMDNSSNAVFISWTTPQMQCSYHGQLKCSVHIMDNSSNAVFISWTTPQMQCSYHGQLLKCSVSCHGQLLKCSVHVMDNSSNAVPIKYSIQQKECILWTILLMQCSCQIYAVYGYKLFICTVLRIQQY